MNKLKYIWVLCFTLTFVSIMAQVPARPNPPRLVNDMAGIFSAEQQQQLEQVLVEFNDSTSNQILVVTVNDLGGQDVAQYAYEIGQTWGVGQKKLNNGLVILIKPKNETNGQIFIATGYGLEGPLPDAICKRIVDNEMIPYFRQNDYFGGVVSALRVIIPIAKGEYKYPAEKKSKGSGLGGLALLILIFIIYILISRRNKNNGNFNGGGGRSSGSDLFTILLLGGLSSRSHGGSWGGFSGGSSSGGGGFGGFGGGSFGGGGAGGSW